MDRGLHYIATSDREQRCILFFDDDPRSYERAEDQIWRWWNEHLINDDQADAMFEKLVRIQQEGRN